MYIALAIAGYSILSVVSILDKYILSAKKTDPGTYVFWSTIFCLPLFIFFFFLKMPAGNWPWVFASLGGLTYGLSLWLMYKGVEKGDVSHIGPLIGAAVPLFTLFFGRYFLHETLTGSQLAAVALLIAGSFLIAFEKRSKGKGLRAGTLWGIASGLTFAISLGFTKSLYNETVFTTGLAMVGFFTGVAGLITAASPLVRRNIFQPQKNNNKRAPVLIANISLSLLGVLLVQLAISMGKITIVNSLEGVRYGLLVLLALFLSKLAPKVFREKHSKSEIFQEFFAVLLIAAGLFFLIK